MRHSRRLLLFSMLLLFGVRSATAGALTVSPSGAYSDLATGSVVLSLTSNGQRLTCTGMLFSYTIDSSGVGTSAAGTTRFSGCTNALLGAFTVTQTSAWSVNIILAAGPLIGKRITIPAGGAQITSGSCSYTVSGTIVIGRAYAALPAAVAVTDVFTVLSSSLTASSIVGCSPLLIVNQLLAAINAGYKLNRAFTVSG